MLFLALIVFGMFAGWIAQILLGRKGYRTNWSLALIAGLVGSFVGGLLFSLLTGNGLDLHPTGLIGSIVGAVVCTAGYWAWKGRQ